MKKKTKSKRDYYHTYLWSQKAEREGKFDHLIHCEEIIAWIGLGLPVSGLTALSNQREQVREFLQMKSLK